MKNTGNWEQFKKSEPYIALADQTESVKQVVSDSWNDIVLNPNFDVLIEFYAPVCSFFFYFYFYLFYIYNLKTHKTVVQTLPTASPYLRKVGRTRRKGIFFFFLFFNAKKTKQHKNNGISFMLAKKY